MLDISTNSCHTAIVKETPAYASAGQRMILHAASATPRFNAAS